jgi:hypothetical protein
MRSALLMAAALCPLILGAQAARADEGDAVRLSRGTLFVGQQQKITLTVVTPVGATVEVDPAAPGWNGVEVIAVTAQSRRDEPGRSVHTIELLVAPFLIGDIPFTPVVTVVTGPVATPRALPETLLKVLSSLAPGDNGELSPLAAPVSIAGAESPFLRPAIVGGVFAATFLLVLGLFLAVRAIARRLRRALPPEVAPGPARGLGGAEALLADDPVGAYRRLATAVRTVLSERYGFPASALTTGELQRRMEAEGVDRWQARLVSGLLEECDAVVYAGYRPAFERREADLTMAREIVEASA